MVTKLQKWAEGDNNPICALGQILTKHDPDIVMNATGAIASLVETVSGRQWLLQNPTVFNQVLESVSIHLDNETENTANSAALILAQLSLCEEACQKILSHPSASKTFRCLTKCLLCSHKDTAMNAAFAVGRLCGSGQAKNLIMRETKEQQLVYKLQSLLSSGTGLEMCQTACFALSCLAKDEDGHALLMESTCISAVLNALLQLLQSAEPDSVWFAAMTLRVLVSRPSGVVIVRKHGALHGQLKVLSVLSTTGPELQEEVNMCLSKLELLPKPPPVRVTILSSMFYTVSWVRCDPESGLEVTYSLFDRDLMLYHGHLCQVTLPVSTNRSVESHSLRLNLSTSDGDVSPFSDPVVTLEPLDTTIKCPQELCVIGCTATHVHLRWVEPEGGVKPKSYQIFCNDTLVKTTTLLGAVVSGLSPGTNYELSARSLCPGYAASTRTVTKVKTADDQDHAPSALTLVVLGRHELQINWRAPAVPLGRLFKYELSLNGCVAYVGTERAHTARRLSANTAYACIVTAVTSRGRCHSRPVIKKTSRDEYLPLNRNLSSAITSKSSTSPPTIQNTREVTKMTTKSQATLGHKPKIHTIRSQHKAHELRKDKHRQVSVQIHLPKEKKLFNHTSKMDKNSPPVGFPENSTDSLVVSSHRQSEDIYQTQTKPSTPEDPTNTKTMISQARKRNRKVPKETLPCVSKQISEDMRLLQPVSFHLSNLKQSRNKSEHKKTEINPFQRFQISRNKDNTMWQHTPNSNDI
ncbi:uncharacterized protein LOC130418780 isoform X2 [Triplophysa dalaica]|nr:uncharacterized protein LOC130418780 isoform X2 [Triplophysa dalaica]